MPITHAKVSAVPDNVAAPGLVQPSEWNAAHVIGALGTPAADGIAFPATQVPSAGANVLDDYEEGAWTPVANTMSFDVAFGSYVKVGRLVIATFSAHLPATGNGNGYQIQGLPFTAAGYHSVIPTGLLTVDKGQVVDAATRCEFTKTPGGGVLLNSDLSNQWFTGSAVYMTT